MKIIKFESFDQLDWLVHGFTTREKGVSSGNYSSLNMGLNTNDDVQNIYQNFDLVLKYLNGINSNKTFLTNQIHETEIKVITTQVSKHKYNIVKATDGLITSLPGVNLMTFYADCVPIYAIDLRKKVIAVVHSGWKGTVKKISHKLIHKFVDIFNSQIEDLRFVIGPCISSCCFEVKWDVAKFFDHKFYKQVDDEHYYLDLKKANKKLLLDKGIQDYQIEVSSYCTKCNDLFYSYRENKNTGRMAAIISIK